MQRMSPACKRAALPGFVTAGFVQHSCPICHSSSSSSSAVTQGHAVTALGASLMNCSPSCCPALFWPVLPRKLNLYPELRESRSFPARLKPRGCLRGASRLGRCSGFCFEQRSRCGDSLPAQGQPQHQSASGNRHVGV